MVIIDRPFIIIKIKLRRRGTKIHICFKISFDRSNIAPIRFPRCGLSGNPVVIEIISKQPFRFHKTGNNIFSEIVTAVLMFIVILQKRDHIFRVENIISHGGKAHIFVIGQRRGIFRFFLKTNDPPIFINLNDPELTSFRNRNRDCRNCCNRVIAGMKINHLTESNFLFFCKTRNIRNVKRIFRFRII